jgi:hypothetical protein
MATFKKVVTETNADTIAQSTTGSAATLTTARAIAVSGDITGTANFDGSAGISISSTLANNAVTNAKMADDAVNSAEIADGAVDPIHLAGLGANGTSGQVLQSDGDGTFSWASPNDGDITGVSL